MYKCWKTTGAKTPILTNIHWQTTVSTNYSVSAARRSDKRFTDLLLTKRARTTILAANFLAEPNLVVYTNTISVEALKT